MRRPLAGPVVGVLADPAGAERVAAAYLQQRALELVALARRGRARLSGGHSHSFGRGVCRSSLPGGPDARSALGWPADGRRSAAQDASLRPGAAGPLEDLIAPPYDVIDDELRAELAAPQPAQRRRGRPAGELRGRGRETLGEWRERGVLVQRGRAGHLGAAPGLHRARRRAPGRAPASSRACAWRSTAPGRIRPHERTHPGPKEDRLRLTRATRANLSPIFSLFPDPGGAATETLAQATSGEPFAEVTDHEGTRNTLWRVADPERIAALQARARRRRAPDRRRPPPLRDRARVRRRGRRRGRPPLRAHAPRGARRPRPARLPHPPPADRPEGRRREADRDPRHGQARLRYRGARRPPQARAARRERPRGVRLHGQLLQAALPLHAQGPVDRRRARSRACPSPTAGSTPPCSRRSSCAARSA